MFGKRTLFMFMGILALGTAIDPDNICILVADGTKIVDDTNCAGYYTCKGGKATASTCPSGYYFNKDTKACVTKSQATCISSEEAPCAGVEDGKFVGMAGSCSGYYYCKNQLAIAGECPNNLNFNPKEEKCMYKNEYACTIAGGNTDTDMINDDPQVVCAYVPEGMFFGNAASCTTWHKCKDGIIKTGFCQGFVFNVQTQSCVVEGTYDCPQLNGDSTQTGGTSLGECKDVLVQIPSAEKMEAREHQNARTFYKVWSKSENLKRDSANTDPEPNKVSEYCDNGNKDKCWTVGEKDENDCSEVCDADDNCFDVCDDADQSISGCTKVCKEDAAAAPKCWSVCAATDNTKYCSKVCVIDADPENCKTVCDKDTQPKKHKDPDSCNTYLTCSNQKFVRNKCPIGQYFSVTDQACTAREDAVNKCDRCQGSSQTFVNAYNDDCVGYFYCSNGRKTADGKCPTNYNFNEKIGSCVIANITFNACQTAAYEEYNVYA